MRSALISETSTGVGMRMIVPNVHLRAVGHLLEMSRKPGDGQQLRLSSFPLLSRPL